MYIYTLKYIYICIYVYLINSTYDCTHIRIRSPRFATSGRLEALWVREVGKFVP